MKTKTFMDWYKILTMVKNWPSGCEVNEWGSCQYYTAKSIYDLYFNIKEDLKLEYGNISNFELRVYLMKLFNIDYDTVIDISSFPEIKKKAISFFKDRVDQNSIYDINQIEHIIKTINDLKIIDELFVIFRNLSYDLWTTVPIIFNWILTGITFDRVYKSPGYGPVLNMSVQSDNYKIGLMCAILIDCDLIKDEESFTNFDT